MLHRNFLLLTCLLIFISQLRASPQIGATVQSWDYVAKDKAVILHVVNTSGKEITAYNVTITEKFVDGTSHTTERTTDLLEESFNGGKTFPEGTSRNDVVPEPNPIANVIPILDVVAYGDGTADVQNQRAFKQLVGRRKASAAAAQEIGDVVMKSPTKGAAKAELSKLADVLSRKNHTGNSNEESWADTALEMRLQEAVSALDHADLKTVGKRYGDLAAAITPHAQLLEKKEGQ